MKTVREMRFRIMWNRRDTVSRKARNIQEIRITQMREERSTRLIRQGTQTRNEKTMEGAHRLATTSGHEAVGTEPSYQESGCLASDRSAEGVRGADDRQWKAVS